MNVKCNSFSVIVIIICLGSQITDSFIYNKNRCQESCHMHKLTRDDTTDLKECIIAPDDISSLFSTQFICEEDETESTSLDSNENSLQNGEFYNEAPQVVSIAAMNNDAEEIDSVTSSDDIFVYDNQGYVDLDSSLNKVFNSNLL